MSTDTITNCFKDCNHLLYQQEDNILTEILTHYETLCENKTFYNGYLCTDTQHHYNNQYKNYYEMSDSDLKAALNVKFNRSIDKDLIQYLTAWNITLHRYLTANQNRPLWEENGNDIFEWMRENKIVMSCIEHLKIVHDFYQADQILLQEQHRLQGKNSDNKKQRTERTDKIGLLEELRQNLIKICKDSVLDSQPTDKLQIESHQQASNAMTIEAKKTLNTHLSGWFIKLCLKIANYFKGGGFALPETKTIQHFSQHITLFKPHDHKNPNTQPELLQSATSLRCTCSYSC